MIVKRIIENFDCVDPLKRREASFVGTSDKSVSRASNEDEWLLFAIAGRRESAIHADGGGRGEVPGVSCRESEAAGSRYRGPMEAESAL